MSQQADQAGEKRGADSAENFEREKWSQELELRRSALQLEQSKLDATDRQNAYSRWFSPLVLAILAATIAAFGNASVAFINGRAQRAMEEANNAAQLKLELFKADAARILEVIKVGTPDVAAVNLDFLLQAGLIDDAARRSALEAFLRKRAPGQGPSLPPPRPAPNDASSLIPEFESFLSTPVIAGSESLIGFGHVLTADELQNRTIKIGSENIPVDRGITKEQAGILLGQDTDVISKRIDELVTVPLNPQQKAVLVSFVWSVGLRNFEKSTVLQVLNNREYDLVADEISHWKSASGRAFPGLVARREAEGAFWRSGSGQVDHP